MSEDRYRLFESYITSATEGARGFEGDPNILAMAQEFDAAVWNYVDNELYRQEL